MTAPPPRLAAVTGVAAALVLDGVFLWAGARRPGYSSISGFVSELSLGPDGWVQKTNFVVSGLLFLVFALGLLRAVAGQRDLVRAARCFVVVGLGLAVCGVFDTDPFPRAVPPSLAGVIHDLSAIIVFSAMTRGLWVFSRGARTSERWAGLASFARVCAVLTGVLFVLGGIAFPHPLKPAAPWLTAQVGLLQRLSQAAFFAGAGAIAVRSWSTARVRA